MSINTIKRGSTTLSRPRLRQIQMQDLGFRHFISVNFTQINSIGALGFNVLFSEFTAGNLNITTAFTEVTSVGDLAIPVTFSQFTVGNLTIPVTFSEFTLNTGVGRNFSAKVLLDDIDVSLAITGLITVEYTEGEAAIAQFVLNPVPGPFDPYNWIDKSVVINYLETDSSGVVVGEFRKFTGKVHLPDYDVTTGFTHFTCTDNLQESLELLSLTEINSIIQGFTDSSVLGESDDNWSYAQTQLSTIPFSYDKDRYGVGRRTPWQAKGTADISLTSSDIIDGSLDLSLAERRNITNKVKLTFEGRQERKWHRELNVSWRGMIYNSFVAWLQKPYTLPTQERVLSALEGWLIKSISFGTLPASGSYFVGTFAQNIVWTLSEYGKTLAAGAVITVAKRWLQTTSAKYCLTVSSTASVSQHGNLSTDLTVATDGTTDSEFENFEEYSSPSGTDLGNGDNVQDTVADWVTPVETAIAQARNIILASHRKNTVTFTSPMIPIIQTDHTVLITTPKLTAKGKVTKITEQIDLEGGSATSSVTLSLYLPNVAGQIDSGISAPVNPVPLPSASTPGEIVLNTHVGNTPTSPLEQEGWTGWITNQEILVTQGFNSFPFYEERFVVQFPEVQSTERDENMGTVTSDISVAIPQDTLS